jgi:SAM-dependent methyltransferase
MRSTERFTDRVADYSKYRPGYPAAVFEAIEAQRSERGAASAASRVPRIAADIGSGTGLFSSGLLARGWTVHAVEPNRAMRAVAEREHGLHTAFHSHDATAEATGLPGGSVGLVAAAQAFHWFDAERCREEWRRILVPGGLVCLVWNVRELGSPFMAAYESVLRELLPEYREVTHRRVEAVRLQQFFAGSFRTERFSQAQAFDWPAFLGRVASSSYAPKPGQHGYAALEAALRHLFAEHEREGVVHFRYETQLSIGGLENA